MNQIRPVTNTHMNPETVAWLVMFAAVLYGLGVFRAVQKMQ
jgi:hypothetical protein